MRGVAIVIALCALTASASAYRELAHGRARLSAGAGARDAPLTAAELSDIATRKATCPFIGSIVAQGLLGIGHSPAASATEQPLALVSDVVAAGNSGAGSTLGYVLKLFATGNHAKQLGTTTPPPGRLDAPVPSGWFALDFPGSQGSHAGHSRILQSDPHALNSGRWSEADFQRLTSKAVNGFLTAKAVGQFIAENIARDPASRTVTSGGLLRVLLPDSLQLLGSFGVSTYRFLSNPLRATAADWRRVTIALTKLLGDDNLIGSAGEFGLLFAFLEFAPHTRASDRAIAIAVSDVTSMFRDKRLPAGWNVWKKSALSWVKFTSQLTFHARHALNAIRK